MTVKEFLYNFMYFFLINGVGSIDLLAEKELSKLMLYIWRYKHPVPEQIRLCG